MFVSVELLLKYGSDPNLGSKKPLAEAARIARDAETSDARDAIFALVDPSPDWRFALPRGCLRSLPLVACLHELLDFALRS